MIKKRPPFDFLLKRLQEPRRFIQSLIGPRQVGKTTIARQVADELGVPSRYITADLATLQDVGNSTTLAHYLELLNGAGLLTGLQKFANHNVRKKGSSPKFTVYNNALISYVG